MAAFLPTGGIERRRLLLAAAASCVQLPARSAAIFTPHEIAEQFEQRVTRRLQVPNFEIRLYGHMVELQVMADRHELLAPQYLLVVDANPHVQAAMLLWRLAPGAYDLLGASPVSTGAPARPHHFETPQGVFERVEGKAMPQVLDFGWQRARHMGGGGRVMPMRLQARAADPQAERRLGTARSDGCILLPASLGHFLDELGLLDAGLRQDLLRQAAPLPFRGRYLVVVDSERDERPPWSPAPAANG